MRKSTIITPFEKLAKRMVQKGDKHISQYGVKKFHHEAHDLLAENRLPEIFDFQALVKESFSTSFKRISQNFASLEFSDLPITIARGNNCFIDLYFWRRRPTVIHNHHFTGAFQCIQGANVDLEFEFQEKSRFGKFHAMGDIQIKKKLQIKAGDIQAIAPLDRFIHQNHHHADLTINLCFRTADIGKNSLSNYLFTGLKFEKDPLQLARIERLVRFSQIQEFDFKKIDFTIDDAIGFLIRTDGIEFQNKMLLKLRAHFSAIVKKETDLNITNLFAKHEVIFNKLQDEYE